MCRLWIGAIFGLGALAWAQVQKQAEPTQHQSNRPTIVQEPVSTPQPPGQSTQPARPAPQVQPAEPAKQPDRPKSAPVRPKTQPTTPAKDPSRPQPTSQPSKAPQS